MEETLRHVWRHPQSFTPYVAWSVAAGIPTVEEW